RPMPRRRPIATCNSAWASGARSSCSPPATASTTAAHWRRSPHWARARAACIAPLGWHINLQLDGRDLPHFEARLRALPCPLVIDHLGKFLGTLATAADSVQSLHRLLDSGRCWIKLSAPYESSIEGPPDYADVAPLAGDLARRHPQRCLWASNWPHPNVRPQPDEAALLAWARDTVADDGTWQQMLVRNPAQ